MILHTGHHSFEFQQARQLRFGSPEDAVNFLKHLGYPDPDVTRQMRELVTQYSEDPADARLTDDQLLQRVAVLLHAGRITVIGREHRTVSAQPAAAAPAPAPAFPLSERAPRAASSSAPSQAVADPPTFGSNSAAQAACLVAAAAAGAPFCQEYGGN